MSDPRVGNRSLLMFVIFTSMIYSGFSFIPVISDLIYWGNIVFRLCFWNYLFISFFEIGRKCFILHNTFYAILTCTRTEGILEHFSVLQMCSLPP